MIFQLTPSRRATINLPPLALRSLISTHALTEGDSIGYFFCAPSDISTHALTEGDFRLPVTLQHHVLHFNSRPHGGRRGLADQGLEPGTISTHALTEGDSRLCRNGVTASISTHALTEGDLEKRWDIHRNHISTHALTEGDKGLAPVRKTLSISTHALTEGDAGSDMHMHGSRHFNSRPHGGRRAGSCFRRCRFHFNSRPHGGRQQI